MITSARMTRFTDGYEKEDDSEGEDLSDPNDGLLDAPGYASLSDSEAE